MSATLDKVKEEVRTLAPDELHEVRELVDSLLEQPPKAQMTEQEFAQYLAAKGVISLPESAVGADAAGEFDSYEPITVGGRPLSEMIIEERR
jgi:hypothetical protein